MSAMRLSTKTNSLLCTGTRVRQYDRRPVPYDGVSGVQCLVSGSATSGYRDGNHLSSELLLQCTRSSFGRGSGKCEEGRVSSTLTLAVQTADPPHRKASAIYFEDALARHRMRVAWPWNPHRVMEFAGRVTCRNAPYPSAGNADSKLTPQGSRTSRHRPERASNSSTVRT